MHRFQPFSTMDNQPYGMIFHIGKHFGAIKNGDLASHLLLWFLASIYLDSGFEPLISHSETLKANMLVFGHCEYDILFVLFDEIKFPPFF